MTEASVNPQVTSSAVEEVRVAAEPIRRTSNKVFYLLGGLVLIVVAGSVWSMTAGEPVAPSAVDRPPMMDSTPGGENQANSARYQETISLANQQGADQAEKFGESFVPTPESVPEPVVPLPDTGLKPWTLPDRPEEPEAAVEKEEPEPARVVAAPVVTPPVARPVQRAPVQPKENPFDSAMMSQMQALSTAWAPQQSAFVDLQAQAQQQEQAAGDALEAGPASSESAEAADGSAVAEGSAIIRAGDILYAEALTSVTSDLPAPVAVEIVSGEHAGARLVGEFASAPGASGLVVRFSSISLTDGMTFPVAAFAVDGVSAETAVASDVNRRLVARYAPLLAASFITGFAQSAATVASTTSQIGESASTTTEAPSTKNNIAAGLAQVGGVLAQDIAANAPRGPEIRIDAGFPMGVIFIESVIAPRTN